MLFPTSLVGSYPQPDWLIDRERLASRLPPRVRARELWRIEEPLLSQALDDASVLAVHAQETAGLDIVTDGEARRESYSNHFSTALEGVDLDNPGQSVDRTGHPNTVPRVVGPLRRRYALAGEDVRFLRGQTTSPVKVTVPGPFTMSQQAQNDYFPDERSLALAYAEVVNEEVREAFDAGAEIVQLDEPYMQARAEKAKEYGVEVLGRALEGVRGTTAVHICFGYAAIVHDRPQAYSFLPELADTAVREVSIETAQSELDCSILAALADKTIILGVLDLADMSVEEPETIVKRVERALEYVPAENLVLAPDCGMKYLPRDVAEGKLRSLVAAARTLRERYGG